MIPLTISDLHALALLLLTIRRMYLGLYQGSAAMTGLEKWQGQISQNIANSGVAGYKGINSRMLGESVGPQGGTGTFSHVLANTMLKAEPHYNFGQGQVVGTDNPMDVAIDGSGFFEVEMPNGRTLYTRDGQFHVNADNVLVNKNDYPVRGNGGLIQLTPGAGEIGIDAGGRIFQGNTQVGNLKITEMTNNDGLEASAGGFVVSEGADPRPRAVENPRVLQGYFEASNTSPVTEMVNLISVSRAYEANQKVIQNQDRLLERATTTFAPQ